MKLDAQGGIKRNLNNPIEKDNIMMPVGGWAVVRFKATNPGKKLTVNSFLSTNQILLWITTKTILHWESDVYI